MYKILRQARATLGRSYFLVGTFYWGVLFIYFQYTTRLTLSTNGQLPISSGILQIQYLYL